MRVLRTTLLALVLLASLAIVGCAAQTEPPAEPPVGAPAETPGDAAGMRLAPGLYDLEGGTVQAVGTLEYSDLEGGFWLITGGTEAEGNVSETVAVIANGAEIESQLKPIEGKSVLATGTRSEGASIRMAGPEIVVTKIEAFSDTPGIAE